MIDVSAEVFDLLGSIQFKELPGTGLMDSARRVTRVPTLDQGVAITDRGFSYGDQTLVIQYKPVSAAHNALVQRLIRLHPTVRATTKDGVFRCSPQLLQRSSEENRFTLLVIEKLSED